MQIIERLLAEIDSRPATASARTLDLRLGPFWTVVRTSIGTGMASTMAAEARPHEGLPVAEAGRLHLRSPRELAELLRSHSPTEAAVGLAALNALIGTPAGPTTEEKALAILEDRARGARLAMVGHFPFAPKLKPLCDELWIFERSHHVRPGVFDETRIPELMPRAQVVAVTATTLINGTLERILPHLAPQAWVMMLGPSTPMTSCLFDLGFHVLCGSLVVDEDQVLHTAGQGGTTKQITGVRRLSLWREAPPSLR